MHAESVRHWAKANFMMHSTLKHRFGPLDEQASILALPAKPVAWHVLATCPATGISKGNPGSPEAEALALGLCQGGQALSKKMP